MAEYKYGAVCENGHLIDYKENQEDLVEQPKCQNCGSKVLRICPNCQEYPLLVRKVTLEDGSYDYRLEDYCRSCGDALPWGPDKVTQFLHNKGISLGSSSSGPTPRETILSHSIRETLNDIKYGGEVIKQVKDGDKCYNNKLWHPALSTYIHAFEWGIIAYLENEENIDIIEQERNGTYYNLAGRSPNLLDVLADHVTLDQKTIDRIEDLNRAERRWMAHHKSGEVLRDEVDSVRSRLGVLLETLFNRE